MGCVGDSTMAATAVHVACQPRSNAGCEARPGGQPYGIVDTTVSFRGFVPGLGKPFEVRMDVWWSPRAPPAHFALKERSSTGDDSFVGFAAPGEGVNLISSTLRVLLLDACRDVSEGWFGAVVVDGGWLGGEAGEWKVGRGVATKAGPSTPKGPGVDLCGIRPPCHARWLNLGSRQTGLPTNNKLQPAACAPIASALPTYLYSFRSRGRGESHSRSR